MAEEQAPPTGTQVQGQLTQARVPCHQAADAFASQDAGGHIPIVVIPERLYRSLNPLVIGAGIALIAGPLAAALLGAGYLVPLGLVLTAALLVLGILRWFYVTIPEGGTAQVRAKTCHRYPGLGFGIRVRRATRPTRRPAARAAFRDRARSRRSA